MAHALDNPRCPPHCARPPSFEPGTVIDEYGLDKQSVYVHGVGVLGVGHCGAQGLIDEATTFLWGELEDRQSL